MLGVLRQAGLEEAADREESFTSTPSDVSHYRKGAAKGIDQWSSKEMHVLPKGASELASKASPQEVIMH